MLTSPVNVTIAAANGAGLKANTAASDNSARREPALLPLVQHQATEQVIEPELPSNSPINHVNAVAATVGNRTVLQELTLNVGNMMRITRKPDETLTSVFLRIIATIEGMSQGERLQFEMRAGLKALKITLADLLMALRKPDGPEAARLTALAEAPASLPGRTAANAATNTYLEEGTSTGHTEETLAMRAAARNSAAGQSVFSAESKMRPADSQPADAKVLQNQLKTLFEPGDTRPVPEQDNVAPQVEREQTATIATEVEPQGHASPEPAHTEALPRSPAFAGEKSEAFTLSTSNLKLDQPSMDKIHAVAQSIAAQPQETASAEPARTAVPAANTEKAENGDRRMQTLLTLKGFAEAVTALPAKAAELLAVVVAEAAAILPEPAEVLEHPAMLQVPPQQNEAILSDLAAVNGEMLAEGMSEAVVSQQAIAETQPESVAAEETIEDHAEAAVADEYQPAANTDRSVPARPDLIQHAVPFAYAQVQPAREEGIRATSEDETHGDGDEESAGERDEDDERRPPRDEYDEIHDPLPEDEPAIVINRDSSEADRAFALYQRMGGF
jgi:hypothetical protein